MKAVILSIFCFLLLCAIESKYKTHKARTESVYTINLINRRDDGHINMNFGL